MGKLTIGEVEDLKKKGVLSDTAIKGLQNKGLVGTRKRGNRKFLKNVNNGTKIYPQLYFSGLGKGNDYTKDMLEIKEKFTSLIEPYTTTKGEKKND
mgnify:CR=1 FL=1|jgi:hypothetical protein